MSAPALLRRFPGLPSRLPWLGLGEWPTPIRPLRELGRELGLEELWVKEDDQSGRVCGGNKVRKLEPLLADARQRGARTLVTVGGIGSNHLVATACYARSLGFRTLGVVFPQPVTPQVEQTLAVLRGLEVELWPCASRLLVPLALRTACNQVEQPYLIGPGASSPLGTLGYVSAGLELAEQVRAGALPEPELIVIALGSGGSSVGLALGLELAGIDTRVLAVRVVERPLCNLTLARLLMARTARLLGCLGVAVDVRRAARRLRVEHGQAGPGYGVVTLAGRCAVARAGQAGLLLETTYTGKAFAALLAPGVARSRILFWNTHNSRDLTELARAGAARPLPPRVRRWIGRTS